MKSCPRCYLEIDNRAGTCTHCGMELGILAEASATEPKTILATENKSIPFWVKFLFWFGAWAAVIASIFRIDPQYLGAAFYFPVGLFCWLQDNDNKSFTTVLTTLDTGAFFFGWLLYAVLSGIILSTGKRGVFIITFLLFCILLILNVSGCQRFWRVHLE